MAKHKNNDQPLKIKGTFEGVIAAVMSEADNRVKKSGNDKMKKDDWTKVSLKLTPVVEWDERTKSYFAHYKEFPRASAIADTEEQVMKDLESIFQVMLKEHKKEITDEALRMLDLL